MSAIERGVSISSMMSLKIGGILYLLVINVWGFAAMGLDKSKAQKQAWRTPEKRLFTLAAVGGSIGVWLGMQTFRHKTKHLSFTWGIPLIFAAQVLIIGMAIYYGR